MASGGSACIDAKSDGFTVRLTDLKIDKTLTTDQRKSHGCQKIELHKRMSHFFSTLFWLSFFIYTEISTTFSAI